MYIEIPDIDVNLHMEIHILKMMTPVREKP